MRTGKGSERKEGWPSMRLRNGFHALKFERDEGQDDGENDEQRRRRVDLGRHREADHRIDFHRERSEEHTSELQSLMRISYAVFCLKKKQNKHARTKTL